MKAERAGIEKGALYRKTEGLLKEYRAMQARLMMLEIEFFDLSGCEPGESHDEAIEGMSFARAVSDMPHSGEISDKTSRIAVNWREQYGKDFDRAWEMYVKEYQTLKGDIAGIKKTIKKIDVAIGSLLPKEKEVVILFYVQGMKWEDVGRRLSYVPDHCKRLRTRAIWYMSKSIYGQWKIY